MEDFEGDHLLEYLQNLTIVQSRIGWLKDFKESGRHMLKCQLI